MLGSCEGYLRAPRNRKIASSANTLVFPSNFTATRLHVSVHYITIIGCQIKITYLLTPWCRVLLDKLTGLQLVKKFPAFHGTRRFITALTSIRQLSLSWASPIQSIYTHPTSWRSNLILSTHLRQSLPSGLFLSGFYTKTLYTSLSSPIRATCAAHSSQHHVLKHYQLPFLPQCQRPSFTPIQNNRQNFSYQIKTL